MKKAQSLFAFTLAIAMAFFLFPSLPQFAQATGTVTGTVKNEEGKGMRAHLNLHTADFSFQTGRSSGDDGTFSIENVPDGSYIMDIFPDFGTNFIPPAPLQVTVAGAGVNLGVITVTEGKKTITGKVMRDNGAAVVGARVNAFVEGGQGGFANTVTGSDGTYALKVTGGTWGVMTEPDDFDPTKPIDWVYIGQPAQATFANNTTPETKSGVDFKVTTTNAVIKGKVVLPNGTPLAQGRADARSQEGMGAGANIRDGKFTINIIAGTYNIFVFSNDNTFGTPPQKPLVIKPGQTIDVGTITLVKKDVVVKGIMKDKTGASVSGADINAWQPGSGGFGNARSGADGSYQLLLLAGEWEIMPMSRPDSDFVYSGQPVRLTLTKGETKTGVNFTMTKADATIQVTAVDSSGKVLTDINGFSDASPEGQQQMGPGFGGPLRGGVATIRVPAGKYRVRLFMPPGNDYTALEEKVVEVATGKSASASITLKKSDAVIAGHLTDKNGTVITGVRADVFAHNQKGAAKFTQTNPDDGSYRLPVVSGIWYMGVHVFGQDYVALFSFDEKTAVNSGETKTKDFKLFKADSEIKGKVLGPDGAGIENVFVFADSNSTPEGVRQNQEFGKGPGIGVETRTGAGGAFTLKVPAGVFGVESAAPPSLNLISPHVKDVSVSPSKPASVTLQYRKSDAQLSGKVTLNGKGQQAFVGAWSEKGGFSHTSTNSDGSYQLNLTKNENWHVFAGADVDTNFYRSDEVIVTIGATGKATQNLALKKASFTLPPAVSTTFDATQAKVITLEDGLEVQIPAGAIAKSGNVTVTITPTAELPKQKSTKSIGYGYDMSAIDDSGNEITDNFSSSVFIKMPYTNEILEDGNLDEDDLLSSFFDDTVDQWRDVSGATKDTDNDDVIISTDHFTKFSITASNAADTTPPSTPTSITVTNPGTGGALNLAWKNPSDSDFSSISIYRSTVTGQIGSKAHEGITGTSKSDTDLTNGTLYYYTIRAVDSSGNESTNTTQYSGTPTSGGATLPETGFDAISVTRFVRLAIGAAFSVFALLTAFVIRSRNILG